MKKDLVLSEAMRLASLGFAIHWLRPKEKSPVKGGSFSLPGEPWDVLEKAYQPGYNVGVRLGSASPIGFLGYLACIDVDIKEPSAKAEALSELAKLVGHASCPEVRTGSGNGSRHLYCVTSEPFKMLTIVKNKRFEICVYSNGRQMALPPSIHPSGRKYAWVKPCVLQADLPLLAFQVPLEGKKTVKKSKSGIVDEALEDFTGIEGLDIRAMDGVSDKIRALIVDGTWNGGTVDDRSAYLLVAANGLASGGLAKDGILTVLTDPSTYLGRCAYDHAKTKSRARAARWLYDFTVKKVLAERDPSPLFAALPVQMQEPLEGKALDDQTEELRDKPEERGYYSVGKNGGLRPEYDALLKVFEEKYPYKTIADMKSVFIFRKTHYADITPIEIKAFAEEKLRPRPEERVRAEFFSKVLANNVKRQDFFSKSIEGKLNFKNGILDLGDSSQALLPHSPDYGFRGVLPYGYDAEARCPFFKKWLNGILLDDPLLVAALQEFMGYVVRGGDYKYHKALWLGGAGRNGKSTFVDVLKALIGPDNYSTISIKALVTDRFASAELDGKIANFSEETSPQELRDSGPFKNLTAGGDVFAQKKFGSPYNFRNKAKVIMTYNRIPDVSDLSQGMLSRPLIIPFDKQIKEGDQDHDIQGKLMEELPGIFNFALEGWRRLERQGSFTNSPRSRYALQAMKEESCTVFQWVEACVEIPEENFGEEDDGHNFKPMELYRHFCNTNRAPYKYIDFCRRLASHPLLQSRKSMAKGKPYYRQIRVTG